MNIACLRLFILQLKTILLQTLYNNADYSIFILQILYHTVHIAGEKKKLLHNLHITTDYSFSRRRQCYYTIIISLQIIHTAGEDNAITVPLYHCRLFILEKKTMLLQTHYLTADYSYCRRRQCYYRPIISLQIIHVAGEDNAITQSLTHCRLFILQKTMLLPSHYITADYSYWRRRQCYYSPIISLQIIHIGEEDNAITDPLYHCRLFILEKKTMLLQIHYLTADYSCCRRRQCY